MSGRLRIQREVMAYTDVGRRGSVEVDGEIVGYVEDGQGVDFEVTPGYHTVIVRIGMTRSVETTFLVGEGETICFLCKPRFRGVVGPSWLFGGAPFALLGVFVKRLAGRIDIVPRNCDELDAEFPTIDL